MKFAAVAGIALVFFLLYRAQEQSPPVRIQNLKTPEFHTSSYRKDLPVFEWDSQNGQTLSHRDLEGRWSLLHFWAHWCLPCHIELPLLHKAVKENPALQNLQVILVNVDQEGSEHQKQAREFLKNQNISLAQREDPYGMLTQSFEVTQYPYHILISPQKQIIYAQAGAINWMSPEVQNSLVRLLTGEAPSTPEASRSE